jgi:hypothetical protein
LLLSFRKTPFSNIACRAMGGSIMPLIIAMHRVRSDNGSLKKKLSARRMLGFIGCG